MPQGRSSLGDNLFRGFISLIKRRFPTRAQAAVGGMACDVLIRAGCFESVSF